MTDHWTDRAACRNAPDPSIFFPERVPGVYTKWLVDRAKEYCNRCPVICECLDEGLDEHHGVWGGTTEEERRRLRKQNRDRNVIKLVNPIPHGTYQGYQMHLRRGIPPCQGCKSAHQAYGTRWA